MKSVPPILGNNAISLIMLEHLIYDCGTGEFTFDTGEPVLTLDELYNLFPEALEAAEEAFTDRGNTKNK